MGHPFDGKQLCPGDHVVVAQIEVDHIEAVVRQPEKRLDMQWQLDGLECVRLRGENRLKASRIGRHRPLLEHAPIWSITDNLKITRDLAKGSSLLGERRK